MSSCCKHDSTGQQVFLDRENWFTAEAHALIEAAVADKDIGPRRTLAMLLHHGLGLSLELVAQLQGVTKNVVAKQVISGKKRIRRLAKKMRDKPVSASLFADQEEPALQIGESQDAIKFMSAFNRVWPDPDAEESDDE